MPLDVLSSLICLPAVQTVWERLRKVIAAKAPEGNPGTAQNHHKWDKPAQTNTTELRAFQPQSRDSQWLYCLRDSFEEERDWNPGN